MYHKYLKELISGERTFSIYSCSLTTHTLEEAQKDS
jgi:hypothetical protein